MKYKIGDLVQCNRAMHTSTKIISNGSMGIVVDDQNSHPNRHPGISSLRNLYKIYFIQDQIEYNLFTDELIILHEI